MRFSKTQLFENLLTIKLQQNKTYDTLTGRVINGYREHKPITMGKLKSMVFSKQN